MTKSFNSDTSKSIDSNIQENINDAINGFNGGFIENTNQKSEHIKFYVQSRSISIGFSQSMMQYVLSSEIDTGSISLEFFGSNEVEPVGRDMLNIKNNYIVGNDKSDWSSDSIFKKIVYYDIYDNIDLHYLLEDGKLKYEFYVYPGGDVDKIKLRWIGPVDINLVDEGMMINVRSTDFSFVDSNPVNYETELREIEIDGSFKQLDDTTYGFDFPYYNKDKLLIIDPTILDFSTYIAGDGDDFGFDSVLDASDNIYVTGYSKSTNFPTTSGVINTTYDGISYTTDVIVFKLSSDGTTLLYSTYIVGSGNEYGNSITVDSSGNAYITGFTGSSDFPTTTGAYDRTKGGGNDIFVTKLSADGSSILFSTFIGGSDRDESNSITLDSSGAIYITGSTDSTDFPTTSGANDTLGDGTTSFSDAFAVKLFADGSALHYSTYISGSSWDTANSVAVDNTGHAYITGITYSSDFPTTTGARDRTLTGATDAFVTKISKDGSYLNYSTYMSLSFSTDDSHSIVLDDGDNAYITGNYYTGGFMAIMVMKLSSDGSTLLSSKSMLSSGNSYGRSITLDNSGNIYVSGFTYADNFPVTSDALYSTGSAGISNVVLFKLSPDMSQLIFSTYIIGSDTDDAKSIAINSKGNILIVGKTASTDFPTTIGAYNTTGNNSTKFDIFVLSILNDDNAVPDINSPSNLDYEYGTTGNSITWDIGDTNPGNYNVTVDGVLFGNELNSWTNGSIIVNIDNLNLGTHEINLTIYDIVGNANSNVVTITVIDTTAPEINYLTDIQYEQTQTGNEINWYPKDPNADKFIVYKDDEIIDSGIFTIATEIKIIIDSLVVGQYNFTIYVNDTQGNFITATIIVTVVDTTIPVVDSPLDIHYELGTTGNSITWDIDDTNPNKYYILNNGSLFGNIIDFINGPITVNIDNLSVGNYNFTIYVNDTSGNYGFDTVIVTVYEIPATTSIPATDTSITTSETNSATSPTSTIVPSISENTFDISTTAESGIFLGVLSMLSFLIIITIKKRK